MASPYTADDVWDDLMLLTIDRSVHYTELQDYYIGEQALPIDPSELNSKFGEVFAEFRDNLAKPIIEAAEGRVRIKEIGTGEGLSKDATEVWEANNMLVESKWVHKEAMVKGDSFVIVLPDEDGDAGIYPQISESCAILYSQVDPRKKVAAIKWWVMYERRSEGSTQDPFIRVNLYFEDRIERYVNQSSGDTLTDDFSKYKQYNDDVEDVDWKTTHEVGEVPMFQFSPNYSLSSGKGISDLEDSTGFIDLITKTFLDMAVASEFTAAPQRWATGIEIPLDPKTGEPLQSFKAGADNMWVVANDAAKFGQFIPGALTAFKSGIDLLVEHLCVVSRTPMYYMMAQTNYPSGEGLKSTEGALRQRVQDHQEDFTIPWRNVLRAALGLNDIKVEDADLKELLPNWLPPNAPFATREHLEELKVHVEVLGVPEQMAWERAGYTSEEIERMLEMREEEAALGLDVNAEFQVDSIVGGQVESAVNGLTPDTLIQTDGQTQVSATAPPN